MIPLPLTDYAIHPVRLPARTSSTLLQGRVAVVTGGARGLGLAIACTLADAGAEIVIAARGVTDLEHAVELIHSRGGNAAFERCDIQDHADAVHLVARSNRHFGPPDVLVNNAGSAAREVAPDGLPAEVFDRLLATNVRGVYYTSIGAAQAFASGGSIINVSSVTARVPDAELTAYGASKAAVESLTRSMAAAYGVLGIRVNAVAPGYTDSPLNHDRKNDPERAAPVLDRTPLGRWGLPEDVANAVCFLASDQSSFITGQVLAVDGGFPTAPPAHRTSNGRKATGDPA